MAKVFRVFAVGVVGALAVLGSAVAQDEVLMRLNLEVGQVYSYQVKSKTEAPDFELINSDITVLTSMSIKGKGESGYEILSEDTYPNASGESGLDNVSVKSILKIDHRGLITDIDRIDSDSEEEQLSGLEWVTFPVEAISIGSRWTQSFSGFKENGIQPGKLLNSVIEKTRWKKWDVLVVKSELMEKQDGFEMTRESYFDLKSGMIVFMKVDFRINLPTVGLAKTSIVQELIKIN